MDDENTQNEFLNSKISSGEISKDKMKQGVYKIQRKGNSYLIEDIKWSRRIFLLDFVVVLKLDYSTVTDFAKFFGLSMSQPLSFAVS